MSDLSAMTAILKEAWTSKYPVFRGNYAQLCALLEATRGRRRPPPKLAERLGVTVEWVDPFAGFTDILKRRYDEPCPEPELEMATIAAWQDGRHGGPDLREWRGPIDADSAAKAAMLGKSVSLLKRHGYRVEEP